MSHIELRDLAEHPRGLRRAPDDLGEWVAEHRRRSAATVWAVADGRHVVGAAAAFTADGDREVAYRLLDPDDAETAAETLRLLVSREPERPLYLRAGDGDAGGDVRAQLGFTGPAGSDGRAVLPPTLE